MIPIILHSINDGETWHLPTTRLLMAEDKQLVLEKISFSDPDHNNQLMELTINVRNGKVILNSKASVTYQLGGDPSGDTVAVLSGTQTELHELIFLPSGHFNSIDSAEEAAIIFSIDDSGDFGGQHIRIQISIFTVTAMNDAPAILWN